ncbi:MULTISPECIES: ATP-binding cassette domain-containing protein [unclassified Paraburkholderia]|uniref:ATP-binding cassette domain-containing protein n=1 Tax=unclassified Paraburkholderia TaxID=2615204 RepID=UPI002AB73469|nr:MULTISPECIES: ATP-binding cassette domain-containing protein [unclassified Paraburkholderia]
MSSIQATHSPDVNDPGPLRERASGGVLYEIEGASFEAGGRVLLQPLTLALTAGRMIALIGHNGSGKSTLLKLLARQQTPSRGSLRFSGREIGAWSAREFARRVAYLPQHPPLATGMTVRELVALGRYPWHGALGRLRSEDAAIIDEALRVTDTARFASQLADHLSGGERQRAWLAMLVAQGASCLLLDEPTSALDIAHQLDVLRLLRSLADDHAMTVVIVLHDINLAARFCDELVALHSGRLLTSGTPADLMQGQVLEAIYGVPMDVVPHPRGGGAIAVAR